MQIELEECPSCRVKNHHHPAGSPKRAAHEVIGEPGPVLHAGPLSNTVEACNVHLLVGSLSKQQFACSWSAPHTQSWWALQFEF